MRSQNAFNKVLKNVIKNISKLTLDREALLDFRILELCGGAEGNCCCIVNHEDGGGESSGPCSPLIVVFEAFEPKPEGETLVKPCCHGGTPGPLKVVQTSF